MALVARAVGDPGKLAEANIDLDGSVTGERPQALLVLLFPDLPAERLAPRLAAPGKLTLKLAGRAEDEARRQRVALDRDDEARLRRDRDRRTKRERRSPARYRSPARMRASRWQLLGLEAPPSAAGVPLALHADIVKQPASIDLNAISGRHRRLARHRERSFRYRRREDALHHRGRAADYISLPSLLGTLVAWQRTPSTEEMLGAIGADASGVWPSRGFSLGLLDKAEGDITLTAKTLALGTPFQVQGATLARQDR